MKRFFIILVTLLFLQVAGRGQAQAQTQEFRTTFRELVAAVQRGNGQYVTATQLPGEVIKSSLAKSNSQDNSVAERIDMIYQVVYNLIDNAVKFTPEGGYIEVSSKADQEKIIVKIRNSGKGVPGEELDKIFERFYKIDKSRSFDVKGAGMGLYLCKTIIELHGGNIIARSEEGEYTEFIFQLPLN